jgi:hypothetical protein
MLSITAHLQHQPRLDDATHGWSLRTIMDRALQVLLPDRQPAALVIVGTVGLGAGIACTPACLKMRPPRVGRSSRADR